MSKKKISKDILIERFREVFGDEYDYSDMVFVDWNTKIRINCRIHGEFWMLPQNHLHNSGCPQCKGRKIRERQILPNEEFIKRAITLHGNKYDYSKTQYINSATKVCIICPEHGEFWQTPNSHLKGNGCRKCRDKRFGEKQILTTAQFIERATKKHKDVKFDYSLVEYKDTHTPIVIRCEKGHTFKQKPCDHLHGSGCPYCKESRGERAIMQYLKANNIQHIYEYKIVPEQSLFGRKYFRADFYLPNCNTIIEFHGEQHYRPVSMWNNSEERFYVQQDRDIRLREYCKKHGISLIEIPYTKLKSINKILSHRKIC